MAEGHYNTVFKIIWNSYHGFKTLKNQIFIPWNTKGLTLSWRRPISYRNQSIDLRSKTYQKFNANLSKTIDSEILKIFCNIEIYFKHFFLLTKKLHIYNYLWTWHNTTVQHTLHIVINHISLVSRKNGQTLVENLAANAARFLISVWPFYEHQAI